MWLLVAHQYASPHSMRNSNPGQGLCVQTGESVKEDNDGLSHSMRLMMDSYFCMWILDQDSEKGEVQRGSF